MQRHFTASAFIVDSTRRVLLLWHRKLNRWMPPGGHIDEHETPEDAARRECKEETGLDVEIIGDTQRDMFLDNPAEGRMLKKPFAMLLENIPAHNGKAAHQHMDFVYRARLIDETQMLTLDTREGVDIRWFTIEEIEKLSDAEMFANVRGFIMQML